MVDKQSYYDRELSARSQYHPHNKWSRKRIVPAEAGRPLTRCGAAIGLEAIKSDKLTIKHIQLALNLQKLNMEVWCNSSSGTILLTSRYNYSDSKIGIMELKHRFAILQLDKYFRNIYVVHIHYGFCCQTIILRWKSILNTNTDNNKSFYARRLYAATRRYINLFQGLSDAK